MMKAGCFGNTEHPAFFVFVTENLHHIFAQKYMATLLKALPKTNARVELLEADFKGLDKLSSVIENTLKRLQIRDDVQSMWSKTDANDSISLRQFDDYLEPIVRKELGKTLAIVRNKAVERARRAGAGSASVAIQRRTYKNTIGGNINISGGKKISYRQRVYEPGKLRTRYVGKRTRSVNTAYGPDRAFILRFLEFGTDIRTARGNGATGRRSQSTYGNRGAIGARSFFGPASADMKIEASKMGTTLINYIERWVDEAFNK